MIGYVPRPPFCQHYLTSSLSLHIALTIDIMDGHGLSNKVQLIKLEYTN